VIPPPSEPSELFEPFEPGPRSGPFLPLYSFPPAGRKTKVIISSQFFCSPVFDSAIMLFEKFLKIHEERRKSG
jgi:hypothetical protein